MSSTFDCHLCQDTGANIRQRNGLVGVSEIYASSVHLRSNDYPVITFEHDLDKIRRLGNVPGNDEALFIGCNEQHHSCDGNQSLGELKELLGNALLYYEDGSRPSMSGCTSNSQVNDCDGKHQVPELRSCGAVRHNRRVLKEAAVCGSQGSSCQRTFEREVRMKHKFASSARDQRLFCMCMAHYSTHAFPPPCML